MPTVVFNNVEEEERELTIPLVVIEGDTIPEVWEEALSSTYHFGTIIKTEYGELSKDCMMIMIVREPLKEPRIHKAGLCIGKLTDLYDYVREVIDGVRDYLVREGRLEYTYHERLFSYTIDGEVVNQINYVIQKLSKAPYTRRAQAITWRPNKDTRIDYPPCLQRLWFRIKDGKLVMHSYWRSRDAFKASFMNVFVLTELQRLIASKLGVEVGEYVDISDSYHIYESDWNRVEKILEELQKRDWKEKTWTSDYYYRLIKVRPKFNLE